MALMIAAAGLFSGRMAQGHEKDEKADHAGKKGEEMKIPDTIGGIWHEIQEHKEELGKIIKDKKLADVHKAAFKIRDYAKALPDKSKGLAAEKLTRVQSSVKQIEKLAADLDASGDAGDQAKTEANFKKLEGVLKLIEAQYSAEMLKMAKSSSNYVCPMDKDVSLTEPGKCPKCGMNLVLKKADEK